MRSAFEVSEERRLDGFIHPGEGLGGAAGGTGSGLNGLPKGGETGFRESRAGEDRRGSGGEEVQGGGVGMAGVFGFL